MSLELGIWLSGEPSVDRLLTALADRLGWSLWSRRPVAGTRVRADGVPVAVTRWEQGPAPREGSVSVPAVPGRDLDRLLLAWPRDSGEELLVDVPVALGRTVTEAEARARDQPVFTETGHPRDQGLFGTLEQCQQRAAELGAAGVTGLRLVLPRPEHVHDLADHVAQLSAIGVGGRLDRLLADGRRSPDPGPPAGWGGPAHAQG